MKKLVTLLLTAALAITAATTAFADDATTQINGTNGNLNQSSNGIPVTYTAAPSYTVTIPATITLTSQTNGTAEGKAKVSATNVTVPYGQSVKVALSSDFQVALQSTSGSTTSAPKLSYKVYKVSDPNKKPASTDFVNDNDTVLEVAPEAAGKTGTATLAFVTDTVVYSGDYTGTVTFKVSVN